ncbi:hypothetical protein SASPL_156224 [Salvia splendens]|uniref:Uncharacterized protein n=1 Tax=Salvia splendens TaxID=180675 RepID=A0A8X8YY56_SALSN|nr:hypothetical protein SASPL_156224 [Salvia splendens]
MRKGTKRKAKAKPEEDQKNEASQSPAEETNSEGPSRNAELDPSRGAAGKAGRKRAKVAKPETETEYFADKRNLEDLWLQVFPVGTEWDQLDMVYEYKWNFTNLEEALEEGGELHDKKVYLFGCTEPQLVPFKDQSKVTMIPVVVAVVSPFPPSDKIGIKSVQRETEEIVPMKQMKWIGSLIYLLRKVSIFPLVLYCCFSLLNC